MNKLARIAVTLLWTFLVYLLSPVVLACAQTPPSGFNGSYLSEWMTRLEHRILDQRLGDIIIPGTYNSGAYCKPTTFSEFRGIESLYNKIFHIPGGSCYHDGDFVDQLTAGFRYFHLKLSLAKRPLVWASGTEDVRVGLAQIANFANHHPKEIVILHIHPISIWNSDTRNDQEHRESRFKGRRELCDVLMTYFRSSLVPASLSLNPTLKEVWATGRNVIVIVRDDAELVAMNLRYFWNDTTRVTEITEDMFDTSTMFVSRSAMFKSFQNVPRRDLTVAVTAVCQSPWGAMGQYIRGPCAYILALTAGSLGSILASIIIKSTRNSVIIRWFASRRRRRRTFSLLVFVVFTVLTLNLLGKVLRSTGFQGVESNLLALSRAANLKGLSALADHAQEEPPLSPIMTQCGINSMLNYWLSRPSVYKTNIVVVSDYRSSVLPVAAINFNLGLLPWKVSLSHAGSPLTGTPSLRRFLPCPALQVAYLVVSRDEGRIVKWAEVPEGHSVTWTEGEYPMDTYVIICVGGTLGTWFQLYGGNLQQWIDAGHDLYVRGTETRAGRGMAYISRSAHHVADTCSYQVVPPGALNATQWDCSTPPVSRQRETPALHPGVVRHIR